MKITDIKCYVLPHIVQPPRFHWRKGLPGDGNGLAPGETAYSALLKVEMFNEGGEIAIFEKVGSNAVFYGQVLFGSLKPRLMYMTTYENMESQKEHWAAFSKHPAWQAMRVKEEYANTVIRALPYLLHPTDYSDF